MNNTPLRYPGGKSIMTRFFEDLLKHNFLKNVVYSEPYAGGAGAAINLLLNDSVEAIRINDASIGIFSFWNSVLTESDRFLDEVDKVEVTLKEWQSQRRIFRNSTSASFELGFATFFLSRTNRSGILGAGPIGGQDENTQRTSSYKIDCRFNKAELTGRLKKIIANRDRIFVSNVDALDFLKRLKDNKAFVYLDPPYYTQGKALYLNYYKHEDHVMLANFLKRSASFDWVLSYDNVPEILEQYSDFPLYQFGLSYTAQDVKKGSELLTHSSRLSFKSLITSKKRKRNESIVLLEITNNEEAIKDC
jgi:DNA adenine methylase